MKVLIAEDEIELQQSILAFLCSDNNICEYASDYSEALYKISLYEYDIAIIDINLITGSGLDLIKFLKKERKKTGIIVISANSSLEDKLVGLDLGADDYLTKPFHLAELYSRMKSIIRRSKFGGDCKIIFNEIEINTDSRSIYISQNLVLLTKKEYDLLLFFIINKEKVLSKESIAEHLWGDHSDLLDNFDFIYVHVNNLRKKMLKHGINYIKTSYGVGYKFTNSEE